MFCIYAPYVSKHKSNCEKQFILLMILNGKEWHYVAVKEVSALLAGIMLRCLRSFATEKKLESHKRLCGNEKFCNIVMSSEDTTILEFNQYQKSDKIIIYYWWRSWLFNRKDWYM